MVTRAAISTERSVEVLWESDKHSDWQCHDSDAETTASQVDSASKGILTTSGRTEPPSCCGRGLRSTIQILVLCVTKPLPHWRKEWAGQAQRERVRDAVQAYMQVRVVHGPLDELHYAQRSICSDLEQQSAHRGRPLTDTILDLQTDAKLAWTCDAFVLGGARVVVANIRRHAWQTWIIHGGAIRVNHLDGEVQLWRGPPPEGRRSPALWGTATAAWSRRDSIFPPPARRPRGRRIRR